MQMKINVKKGTEEHAECETDEITIYVSGSIEKQREMCLYALLELFTNEN